jgi:hypothetical protein
MSPRARSLANSSPRTSPWVHSTAPSLSRAANSSTRWSRSPSVPRSSTASRSRSSAAASGSSVWRQRSDGLVNSRRMWRSARVSRSPSAWAHPRMLRGRSGSGPAQWRLWPAWAWRTSSRIGRNPPARRRRCPSTLHRTHRRPSVSPTGLRRSKFTKSSPWPRCSGMSKRPSCRSARLPGTGGRGLAHAKQARGLHRLAAEELADYQAQITAVKDNADRPPWRSASPA